MGWELEFALNLVLCRSQEAIRYTLCTPKKKKNQKHFAKRFLKVSGPAPIVLSSGSGLLAHYGELVWAMDKIVKSRFQSTRQTVASIWALLCVFFFK